MKTRHLLALLALVAAPVTAQRPAEGRPDAQRPDQDRPEVARPDQDRPDAQRPEQGRPDGERGRPAPQRPRPAFEPGTRVPRERPNMAAGMSRGEALAIALREEGIHRDRLARLAALRRIAEARGMDRAKITELDALEQREKARYKKMVQKAATLLDPEIVQYIKQQIESGRERPAPTPGRGETPSRGE